MILDYILDLEEKISAVLPVRANTQLVSPTKDNQQFAVIEFILEEDVSDICQTMGDYQINVYMVDSNTPDRVTLFEKCKQVVSLLQSNQHTGVFVESMSTSVNTKEFVRITSNRIV